MRLELGVDLRRRLGEEDGVVVALAHLAAVGAGDLRRLGEQRLRLGEHLAVEAVEAARDLARQLEVRHLVDADRHAARLVEQDVGRLQHRIAEQPVVELAHLAVVVAADQAELARLLLDGRVAQQPRRRDDHRQQQVQLGVLLDRRLRERGRPSAGSSPAASQSSTMSCVLARDAAGVLVAGGERVPVGDEEEALGLVLQRQPVAQRAVQVAEVQPAGRPDAADDPHAPRRRAPPSPCSRRVAARPRTPLPVRRGSQQRADHEIRHRSDHGARACR